MAKPNKDRDRRAVIDQMRRDQKRSERRRTIAVIVACAVVGLIIIGAAAIPLIRQNKAASGSLSDIGTAKGSAGCQDVVRKKASGTQVHKPEGTPITYADAPPAFGPHYPTPAAFGRKFYTVDDRPEVAQLVHNLEHGYTLLWYDATVAGEGKQLTDVRAIASKFEGKKLGDKFIAVPWTSKDGKAFPKGTHVALTHWSAGGAPTDPTKQEGVWQYCAKPSGAAVSSFMKDYPFSDSPEPQGA